MKGNRSRKEQEAYERLMKQQAELKEKQAAQKTKESQKYVAAGKKSAYEAAQNSTGSGRQGWIQDRNGKNMPQPRKTKARETGTETYAGAGKGQSKAKGSPASPGKRDYTGTWVNTAGPGGGTEIWKLVALEPGETAADYYEKKRRKHEEEQKEIDAAFRRALEETQKELREQRLGVAEGFGRKKRYNRNYEDLFGLPEGGDFRSRVEGTRGWDKLNGSEQYDRMVYIQKELERREKEREKGAEIGYNGGKGNEAALKELFQAWDRRYAAERSGVQRPKDLVDRKPWSRTGAEGNVVKAVWREPAAQQKTWAYPMPGSIGGGKTEPKQADAAWSRPAIVKGAEELPEDVWNGLNPREHLNAAGGIERPKQQKAWFAGERKTIGQPKTDGTSAEFLATRNASEPEKMEARKFQSFQNKNNSHYGKVAIRNSLEDDKYISLEENGQRDKSYETLPEEMKELYDILGEFTNDGYVMINGQELKYDECLEYDSAGNIIAGEDGKPKLKEGYLKALQDEINITYKDKDEKYKERLLEATCFIIAQEGQKQNHVKANPDKVLNITDKYNDEISGYVERPGAWIWDMLSEAGGTKVGVLNLKSNPESINKMCEGQIPQQIMENAINTGGTEGVAYLQREGYGYFQVGDRVMSAEELGNYTLGLLAEAKGYSPGLAYWAATTDNVKNRMMAGEVEAAWPENHVISGEMYDKYFQRMGVEDAWRWK